MEYLKTYETFQLELNEYSLNEGFWQNVGDFMTKPFAKIVKSRLDKKTDNQKLDLLEKLLKGINFTHTWKGAALTYSPLAILPIIKVLIPSVATEEQIAYWIYWIIWMLIITLRFRYKTEVRNLIGMVKNDYVRNKMKDVVDNKSDVDPFGEESWGEKRGPDRFEDRAEALLKDSYVCDIEVTFDKNQDPNLPAYNDEQVLNVILWNILELHNFIDIANLYNHENIEKELIGNKAIIKNMYIKMDKLKQFEKACIKKLERVGRLVSLSNINVEVIKKEM